MCVVDPFLNVIIDNGGIDSSDFDLFPADEKVVVLDPPVDMFDLLVMPKVFPSKGQARKNWKHSSLVPPGFSMWVCGKDKRQLTILLPKFQPTFWWVLEGVGL